MLIHFLIGLATGILSGFGIGGGSLLILWLTAVENMPQFRAGGLNLLYFICCAPAALFSHVKNKLVEGKAVLWCVLAGVPTSIVAALFAAGVDTDWLRRAFGLLLLYIGIRELFCKKAPDTEASTK